MCQKYSSLLFQKLCALGAELLQVDGRTDGQTNITNLTVAFRKFSEKPKTSIQNYIYIYIYISAKHIIPNILCFQFLLIEVTYNFSASDITIFFQNWGDYTDITQAVLVYITYASDVLLICWFGTQLTQHVRQNGLLLVLLTL